MTEPKTLLDIKNLRTYFDTQDGVVKAVDGVTLRIAEGETLGLVGESGSGKSVTSLTIMRLLPEVSARIADGSISYLGQDLVKLPPAQMRDIRGSDIAMIFQEPGTSLNPVFRVGAQVIEAIVQAPARVESGGPQTDDRICSTKWASPIPSGASTVSRTKCRADRSSG